MPQENAEKSRKIAWVVVKLSNFFLICGTRSDGDESWCPSAVSPMDAFPFGPRRQWELGN